MDMKPPIQSQLVLSGQLTRKVQPTLPLLGQADGLESLPVRLAPKSEARSTPISSTTSSSALLTQFFGPGKVISNGLLKPLSMRPVILQALALLAQEPNATQPKPALLQLSHSATALQAHPSSSQIAPR